MVHDWLRTLSAKAKAKINMRIRNLEVLPREQWGDWTGAMTGPAWNGIFEIRIRYDNVQYRPLFCYGPGANASTILMGSEERGGDIEPRFAPKTCQLRKAEINGGNHAIRHDFS